jgi:hypothetical protein
MSIHAHINKRTHSSPPGPLIFARFYKWPCNGSFPFPRFPVKHSQIKFNRKQEGLQSHWPVVALNKIEWNQIYTNSSLLQSRITGPGSPLSLLFNTYQRHKTVIKEPESWSWPLASIECQGLEWVELYPHSPESLHDMQWDNWDLKFIICFLRA